MASSKSRRSLTIPWLWHRLTPRLTGFLTDGQFHFAQEMKIQFEEFLEEHGAVLVSESVMSRAEAIESKEWERSSAYILGALQRRVEERFSAANTTPPIAFYQLALKLAQIIVYNETGRSEFFYQGWRKAVEAVDSPDKEPQLSSASSADVFGE